MVFFQAEDGMRDTSVTGVQTCALPIYMSVIFLGAPFLAIAMTGNNLSRAEGRSEERRVGKECRFWWSPYHEKKKIVNSREGAIPK